MDSSLAPPTLYHVPKTISSPIYQVLLELQLVNCPIYVETLTFADLKRPEYLQRNPMGTSPAFTDEQHDICIWESGAVMTYILETYDVHHVLSCPPPQTIAPSSPTKDLRQPSTTNAYKARAQFLHLQQFIIATVYPFVASLFLRTLVALKDEQDKKHIAKGKETWRNHLAPTLLHFLGNQDYFMGDKITAIDFLVGKPLNNAHSMGLLEEFQPLFTLFEKIRNRPSFALAYNQTGSPDGNECRSMVLVPGEDKKK